MAHNRAAWLAMARAEARRILGEVAKGCDPAGGKQEDRKAATVADFAIFISRPQRRVAF